jgi:hypothetical protein
MKNYNEDLLKKNYFDSNQSETVLKLEENKFDQFLKGLSKK